MRNLKSLILILFILLGNHTYSQDEDQAANFLSKAKSSLRYKEYEKAEEYLLKSIYFNPKKYETYLILGDLYFSQKKYTAVTDNFIVTDSLPHFYSIKKKRANSIFYKHKNKSWKQKEH